MRNSVKTRKAIIATLSLSAMLCMGFAATQVSTEKASAAETSFTTTVAGFTQEKGASIRYANEPQTGTLINDPTDGIRFTASITNAALDSITGNGQNSIAEVGMRIVKGNTITSDNVETALAEGGKNFAADVSSWNYQYTVDTADDNETHKYTVAIYGIDDVMKKYAALAYITVGETTYYAEVEEGGNIRSAFQVAEAFKADGYKNETGTEATPEQKEYINGVINVATQGVEYSWDDTTSTYYVSGIADASALTANENGDVVVEILPEYETLEHGKAAVTYLGKECFNKNTAITHLILPESVTTIKQAACANMTNLECVNLGGVTEITSTSDQNQFLNCTKLTAVIVKKGIKVTSNQCFHDLSAAPKTNTITVCALTSGGQVLRSGDNKMLTLPGGTNGGSPITLGDAVCGSNTWKYADNGYDVVVAKETHEYENGTCSNCGAYNTMGVTYEYVAGANDDAANGVYTGSYQVTDITGDHTGDATDAEKALLENPEGTEDYILRILEKYDDGIHGELDVTSVKASAFSSTGAGATNRLAREVTHLILPSTVTTLNQFCFANMVKLRYVSMLGVTSLDVNSPFQNNKTITQMIVNQNLSVTTNLGFSASITASSVTIYTEQAASANEQVKMETNLAAFSNVKDGTVVTPLVMGTDWEYDTDGYTIKSITVA